jgi:hypothetical protein
MSLYLSIWGIMPTVLGEGLCVKGKTEVFRVKG